MPVIGPNNINKHWQYIVQGSPYLPAGTYSNATVSVNEYGQILGISSSNIPAIAVVNTPTDLATIINPNNGDQAVVLNNDGAGSEALYVFNSTIWNLLSDSEVNAGDGVINEVNNNSITLAPITNVGAPIPANAIVKRVHLSITNQYSVGATVEIRDAGGTGVVYMSTTQNNPQAVDEYTVEWPQNRTTVGLGNEQLVVVIGGAPVAGSAVVYVEYTID